MSQVSDVHDDEFTEEEEKEAISTNITMACFQTAISLIQLTMCSIKFKARRSVTTKLSHSVSLQWGRPRANSLVSLPAAGKPARKRRHDRIRVDISTARVHGCAGEHGFFFDTGLGYRT